MNQNKIYLLVDRSTLKHLRFPFSFFLLPVFMFALSQADTINRIDTAFSFFILHVLVFPASNGYNSYQDKDEFSIGGIKHPPPVNKNLYYTTLIFDVLAVVLGLYISITFSVLIMIFILMSRAYSYRQIRLKRFPVIGYITVFIFQGGFIYLVSTMAITGHSFLEIWNVQNTICMLISSLFIGSMYPLTQIYQHESDKKDGVTSLSYLLGYNGTFVFSGVLFFLATILMMLHFYTGHQYVSIFFFLPFITVMAVHMSKWFQHVRRDIKQANFENTMSMNKISSFSMNLYFLILVIYNNKVWF
jgi:1,4-dihydroxy-2-naphthoate polyprenyltransferase